MAKSVARFGRRISNVARAPARARGPGTRTAGLVEKAVSYPRRVARLAVAFPPLFALFALFTLGWACNAGLYQGPDRPEDPDVLGPPPPANFHCAERGQRRVEKHDAGSARIVYVLGSGEVVCSTEDKDQDGVIDTWNRHENGKVVEQTPAQGGGRATDAGARSSGR
jgi:hypothetical protein